MKKLIIEVRANENALRNDNPNVPWSSEELARDATRCKEAGAAIYHFHPRNAVGEQVSDLESYRKSVRAIRKESGLLIHPTLVIHGSASERIAPLIELAKTPELRPDFAPLDVGSSNLDAWDSVQHKCLGESASVNTVASLIEMSGALTAKMIKPALIAWNIPFLRRIEAMTKSSVFSEPNFVQLVLASDSLPAVHPATRGGLDAFLGCMPDVRMEWSVMCYGTSFLPLLPAVIENGGHIAIGLGDFAYKEMGAPDNAALVQAVVEIAAKYDREIATPAETREMLAMA